MSQFNLDKIKPEFRYLVDLLFFTDRIDIDLSKFKDLLEEDRQEHSRYLLDRFTKSCEIAWQNGEQFWINRLSFLYSLDNKAISKYIEHHLERRMFSLIRVKKRLYPQYDLPYLQFIAYCSVKCKRHDNLNALKNYFIELPAHTELEKLISIVQSLIPILFHDMNEYAAAISRNIIHSSRNFELLRALEKHNIVFDKQPMVQLAQEILAKKTYSDKNARAFFAIINDSTILKRLKSQYQPDYRAHLLEFISNCDYNILDECHFRNMKNIFSLDPSVANDVVIIYTDKLYSKKSHHKKANADRLIRLIKSFPQISSKKVLAHLSSSNKIPDIKYILAAFPSLKRLAAFV